MFVVPGICFNVTIYTLLLTKLLSTGYDIAISYNIFKIVERIDTNLLAFLNK